MQIECGWIKHRCIDCEWIEHRCTECGWFEYGFRLNVGGLNIGALTVSGLNIGALNVGGFEHSTGLNVDVRLSVGEFLKVGFRIDWWIEHGCRLNVGGLNMGAD